MAASWLGSLLPRQARTWAVDALTNRAGLDSIQIRNYLITDVSHPHFLFHILSLSPHMTFIYLHFPYFPLLKSFSHVDTHIVPIHSLTHVRHAVSMIPTSLFSFPSTLVTTAWHGIGVQCLVLFSDFHTLFYVFFFWPRRMGMDPLKSALCTMIYLLRQ